MSNIIIDTIFLKFQKTITYHCVVSLTIKYFRGLSTSSFDLNLRQQVNKARWSINWNLVCGCTFLGVVARCGIAMIFWHFYCRYEYFKLGIFRSFNYFYFCFNTYICICTYIYLYIWVNRNVFAWLVRDCLYILYPKHICIYILYIRGVLRRLSARTILNIFQTLDMVR